MGIWDGARQNDPTGELCGCKCASGYLVLRLVVTGAPDLMGIQSCEIGWNKNGRGYKLRWKAPYIIPMPRGGGRNVKARFLDTERTIFARNTLVGIIRKRRKNFGKSAHSAFSKYSKDSRFLFHINFDKLFDFY